MIIKYGMILAAGLGKRMQPLTLKTPKPLLEINNLTLLERAINLLISHGVQEISINVHYLPEQIQSFISKKKYKAKITISNEEDLLLDTGGGVVKGSQNFGDNPFFVINPDTVWSKHYLEELKTLEEIYFKDNKPTLLLVHKKLSIDPSFEGDFNLNNEKISKDDENQFIFTGLQITNRSVLINEKTEVFSMNKVWNKLIKDKKLLGLESNQKFYHLNTFDMYKKILSLNITD
jgi:MurNAc alpha-1-phosphate uridylyltransferase